MHMNRAKGWEQKPLMWRILHSCLLICIFITTATAVEPFQFENVTVDVVDVNPPIDGNVFDYAFMDINDDNLLDIVINNHNTHQEPVWLGTPDFKFKYWKNLPAENRTYSGFWLGEVDHNGDGKTDLVYTANEGGAVISHNLSEAGSADPQFSRTHIGGSSSQVSFIDFDGDGALESIFRRGKIYKDLDASPTTVDFFHGLWTLSDFNNDGWIDVYAPGRNKTSHTSWNGPLRYLRNNQGQLEEIQGTNPVLNYIGGIARTADFNNDGNMDLYLFHAWNTADSAKYPIKMYFGDGNFGFVDVTDSAGFSAATDKEGYTHIYIVDIDNDSHVDIVNQGNYGTNVWRNKGDGTFKKVGSKFSWAPSGKHFRFDDYDMDGKLDVVTGGPGASWSSRNTSISVFRNISQNSNNWFKLQLRQTDKNTQALGAAVRIYKAGTQELIGHKLMMSDTMALHPRLHFGLGAASLIDVQVTWPSSKATQTFTNIAANRYVVLREDGSVTDVVYPTSGGNNSPVANAGADQTVSENDAVSLNGSASSDSDGNIVSYAWSQSSGPTVTLSSASAVAPTFTAPAGPATLSFSLTVTDNDGATNSDSVSINVLNGNAIPVANDQAVTTDEDNAAGIILTADDADSDPLTFAIVDQPSNGSLAGSPPNMTYTPNADFNGADSFTFRVHDGSANSNIATVSITVNAVNDQAIAEAQSLATSENEALAIVLSASDVDNDALTYAVQNAPSNGVLSGTAPNLTYTPNLDFTGTDSFTFIANDGTVNSTAATISIVVNPVSTNGAFLESNGMVVIEAEHYDTLSPGINAAVNSTWEEFNFTGASGTMMEATPDAGVNAKNTTIGPKLSYPVQFTTTGTYYIWVRLWGKHWASGSVHVGLDTPVSYYSYGVYSKSNQWVWMQKAGGTKLKVDVTQAGLRTVNLWMRTDGSRVDKLILTTDAGFTPSDTGPAESPRDGSAPVNELPIANAGSDQIVADSDSVAGESVTLDGSQSSDSDGNIVSYSWAIDGTEIATGINPSLQLSDGAHTITLTVTDDEGATASDDVLITVVAPVAPLSIDMLTLTVHGIIDGGVPPYSLEINGVSATVENDGSWQATIQLPAEYSGTVEAAVTDGTGTVRIRDLLLDEGNVTVNPQ